MFYQKVEINYTKVCVMSNEGWLLEFERRLPA